MTSTKAIFAVIIVAVVLVSAVGIYVYQNNSDSNDKATTVVDALGREVFIESSDKIIITSSVETEMACGIGASDRIVGVSSDSGIYDVPSSIIGLTDDDFPQCINDGINDGTISEMGGTWKQTAEGLASVESDLIILSYMSYTQSGLEGQLDALELTYIVTYDNANIEEIYKNIELIGAAIGESDNADKLIEEMKAVIDTVDSAISTFASKDVGVMMSPYYATGSEYVLGSIIKDLGSENAFSAIEGKYGMVNAEGIASMEPRVLIYTFMSMIGMTPDQFYESLLSDPVLSELSAVKEGTVYILDGTADETMTSTSMRFVETYALMATIIYADELEIDLPNVIGDDYQQYINWILDN